jgi:hypothetical protein
MSPCATNINTADSLCMLNFFGFVLEASPVRESLPQWLTWSPSNQGFHLTLVKSCRNESSHLLYRAAHYFRTRQLADDLEGQAATWQLIRHLYCLGDTPAGVGGPMLGGVGGRRTYRQQARAAVTNDPMLNR